MKPTSSKVSRDATQSSEKILLQAQADSWDGPHFQLFFCGVDFFTQTPPPRALFLDAMEPVGCWQYVLSGEFYYQVDNQRHRVNTGEALITRRPDPGWIIHDIHDIPVRTIWLTVKGEMALQTFDYLYAKFGLIQKFPLNSPTVNLAKRLINLVYEEPHRSPSFWSEKTFQWMNAWWWYSQLHHAARSDNKHDVVQPLSAMKQPPVTVTNFATQMGYSRSYLTRKLTHQWSQSPGVVLRLVRLQEAANLLRSTNLSIREIAQRIGYKASAQFGRAFMSHYKQSPRDYRHTHR